jgi:hypothetical protein
MIVLSCGSRVLYAIHLEGKNVTSFSSAVGFLFFLQSPTICCYQCCRAQQEDYCRGSLCSHGRKHSRQVMEANSTSSCRASSTSADRPRGDVSVTSARICPTGSRRSSDGPPNPPRPTLASTRAWQGPFRLLSRGIGRNLIFYVREPMGQPYRRVAEAH